MGWFKKTWNLLAQGYKDIRDFREFRKVMEKEEADMNSPYNKFELNRNKLGNIIYKTVDIPMEYLETDGYTSTDEYFFVMDSCRAIFRYFQSDLNFGEYMLTDVYHFEAVDARPDEIVQTYQIEFVFKPIALTRPLFWFYFIGLCVLLGGVGFVAYTALF